VVVATLLPPKKADHKVSAMEAAEAMAGRLVFGGRANLPGGRRCRPAV